MTLVKQPEVVVVTGGTAGIGRAVVRKLAMQGAKIGIIARDCDRLEQTKEEVETIGGSAVIVSADVSNADQVEQAAAEIEWTFGPIDIWINNAMASFFSPFKQMTPDEFRRVTEVSYLGYVHGTMAALRRMIPRDQGTIVQVNSALAGRGMPLQSAYCGAKLAIQGFTDSVRSELLHDDSNVHITLVQLPAINTPRFEWVRSNLDRRPQPVPPVFQPETAADAVLWAAHHPLRQVHIGGSPVDSFWGRKFTPPVLDKRRARTYYEAQLSREPEDPNRPDNLHQAVPGDYEAHGRFDNRTSRGRSELWVAKYKNPLAWGLAAAGAAGIVALIAAGKKKRYRSTARRIDAAIQAA
jgi:NAD(P)-dependent dehydrogenase (short-subunit alcohol dehydrogenase family)